MFEPDILVTAKDSATVHVVVEVKASIEGMDRVEEELRRYMVSYNCPIGLLIAPRRLRVFRNRFRSYTSDSVDMVADDDVALFDAWADMAGSDRGDQMSRFEAAVQEWLEQLPNEATREVLPAALRSLLEDDVVPYIRSGEVGAAHHRYAASWASERDHAR